MWKYNWQLLCWAFSGAWAIAGGVATVCSIIGGIIAWRSPRLETPMKNLFWLIPLSILLVFFIFRMFQAPYHFYSKQQKEVDSLKREINQKGFDLKIGGMVIMGVSGDSTRIQLTVTVVNHGFPATAHAWNLVVSTSARELNTIYMPGELPAKDSLLVPPLDERLHSILGTNDEITGMLNFILPKISQSDIERLKDDPQAKLVLSVLDNANRKWSGERNIMEMASEKYEHRPSK